MTPLPLASKFATVTLAGGSGVASIGPNRVREHWQLSAASVSVTFTGTGPVSESVCRLYIGSNITSATFVSQTQTGSSGDTCGLGNIDIQPGMLLWASWTNGDTGQIATITAVGTYTIGSPSDSA